MRQRSTLEVSGRWDLCGWYAWESGHKNKGHKTELGLDGRMGSGESVEDRSAAVTLWPTAGRQDTCSCSKDLSKTDLAWVKASLQQRSHNPKPGKDDRPWHVWHFPDRQGWWPRQAQVSMSIRTRAAWLAQPHLPLFENYSFKCESSS